MFIEKIITIDWNDLVLFGQKLSHGKKCTIALEKIPEHAPIKDVYLVKSTFHDDKVISSNVLSSHFRCKF